MEKPEAASRHHGLFSDFPICTSIKEGHVAHGLGLALSVHHDLVPAMQGDRGAVPKPRGFPPTDTELSLLAEMATRIGSAFGVHLIVADFVRDRRGGWHFLEAGAGSAAGTAHEAVFKFVAQAILGTHPRFIGDSVGGPL